MSGYYTRMRIVVLGAGGARKTETSIVRAARSLGHACRLVNTVWLSRYLPPLSSRVAAYLTDEFEPDLIILTRHAIDLGQPVITALVQRRPAVFWYFDLEPTEKVVALGRLTNRMFVTCFGQIETYQRAGVSDVKFLPQGVDPVIDVPAQRARHQYRCDTSFVGSGHSRHRYDVLRAVARVSRLQIRGVGWDDAPPELPIAGGPVHGPRLAEVVCGASISLGANAHPSLDTYRASASNRMWKIFGCGGFYLGRHVEDIDQFAADGIHCSWYRDPTHAAELTEHYLSHSDERERIAQSGRAHALAHHTYAHRLALLLDGKGYPL
jgi:Glycosyl transferases group 1/DUF based on E. rectale Gene description (DUF3880)